MFIIGFKEQKKKKTIDIIIKSILSPLRKTQGFWIGCVNEDLSLDLNRKKQMHGQFM